MSPLEAPRRIVTSNLALPGALATATNPQPEVAVLEETILPISLLDGNAAKWPVYTHQKVPTSVNEPYNVLPVPGPKTPSHQGANVQYNDLAPGTRVPLHRTTQTDYMVFLQGEVILGVPEEAYDPAINKTPKIREVICRPGDVVIQRGTLHSWENRSTTEWARFVGIGLRAQPVEVDITGVSEDASAPAKRVLEDTFDP